MSTNTVTSEEIADIDAMLAGLDAPVETIEGAVVEQEIEPGDIVEEAIEPLSEAEANEVAGIVAAMEQAPAASELGAGLEIRAEEIEAALREIDVAAARAEAYAEQDENAIVEDERIKPAEAPPGKVAAVETRKPKASSAAATPKAPRTNVADLPAEAFLLDTSVDDADAAAMTANKAAVLARRPGQVKVAEKFDNLIQSIHGGRLPSTYTVDCYRVLKAGGSTTSAALAAALNATDKKGGAGTYSIGTARSQAGQFMALALALKIATRVGKELVLNPDSTIAMVLDAQLGL